MSQKTMREDLRSLIIADTAISALISERVHATLAVRSPTHPFVVLTVVGGSQLYSHSGRDAGKQTRIQFDIHAESATQCEQVFDAIDAKLSGFNNTTSGDTHFGAIFYASEYDAHSEDLSTDGTGGVFRKVVDYRIDWQTKASLGLDPASGDVTIGGSGVTIGGEDVSIGKD